MYDDGFDEQSGQPGAPPHSGALPQRKLADIIGLTLMVAGALTVVVGVGALWTPWAGVTLAGALAIGGGYLIASGE